MCGWGGALSPCLCIYTDGSGIDGHVGAAAVCPKISRTSQRYLGSDKEQNVYSAEVTAFESAAEIALVSPPSFTKCVIYADSQAAIRGINNPKKQSGQSSLILAICKIEALVETRNMTTKIKWVPGHLDVEGNEEADKAAKMAAKSAGRDPNIPRSVHKPFKSARSVSIKRNITKSWQFQSQTASDAKQLGRISSKPNTKPGATLCNAVKSQAQAA